MKIETRVEALELELKILKAEIQNTLLEIREQVLNHYYPELRAEEPLRRMGIAKVAPQKPVESRPAKGSQEYASEERDGQEPGNRNGRANVQAKPASPLDTAAPIQPFSDIFLQDIEQDDDQEPDFVAPPRRLNTFSIDSAGADDDDDDGDIDELDEMDDLTSPLPSVKVTPKTREVNYQQLKTAASEQAPKIKVKEERGDAQGPKASPSRRGFAALAAWVGDSIAKVGKEGTVQVIETYTATGGVLSSEIKSSILQLASLANDAQPAGPVGNKEMLSLMVALDQVLAEQ